MWKRVILIALGVAAVAALAFGTITVAADPATPATPGAQSYHLHLAQVIRLLSIKDQAKLGDFLNTQVTNGKITSDQAAQIETFWTNHHVQFQKRAVVGAVLRIQDESKLESLLNQGVASGKITQAQADKIQAVWEKLHATTSTQ